MIITTIHPQRRQSLIECLDQCLPMGMATGDDEVKGIGVGVQGQGPEMPLLTKEAITVDAPLPAHMEHTFETMGWTSDLASEDPFESLR